MNRAILFRGKRVDNGELIVSDSIMQIKGQNPRLWVEYEGWVEVIRETVGQYTGLKDKNYNRIFEGDIVEFTDKYTGRKGRAKIVFEAFKWKYSGCYYGGNPIVWLCINDTSIEFEVIGNIHDNPELLEAEK